MAGGYLSEPAAGTLLLRSLFAMTTVGHPRATPTHPGMGQRLAL